MRAMQPLRPLSEIIGRDNFVSGYDIDSRTRAARRRPRTATARGTVRIARRIGERSVRERTTALRNPGLQDDRPRFERNGGERFQNDRPAR